MFETLASKTFFLLTLSLFTAYIGSLLSARSIGVALKNGNTAKIKNMQIAALVAEIIVFITLMFLQNKTPLNMVLMFAFTFLSGFTMGVVMITRGDVAQKAVLLTALTTLAAGLVATYGGIDFTWMGKILFIALIILIIISVIRLFTKIQAGRRISAAFGVIIFTGYLLFDFNRLAKLKNIVEANNWETALNFAISIYLDIVNLLLQLMDLLSSGN
jgi:FtsH-binding integral membrane protein